MPVCMFDDCSHDALFCLVNSCAASLHACASSLSLSVLAGRPMRSTFPLFSYVTPRLNPGHRDKNRMINK